MVAVVPELALSHEPCRVSGGTHRGVWIRAWDGDYRASDTEIQGGYSPRAASLDSTANLRREPLAAVSTQNSSTSSSVLAGRGPSS